MATRVASLVKSTKVAQLAQRKDGTVGALSSDGLDIYTVRLSPLSCTCRGFSFYGHCYHSTQAVERFGKPEPIDATARANELLYA